MESNVETFGGPILFDCSNPIEEYNCETCPSFQTSFLAFLKRHILSNHKNKKFEEKVYQCLRCCYFVTSSRYLLVRHDFNNCVKGGRDEKDKQSVKCKNNITITLQEELCNAQGRGQSSSDFGPKSSEKNSTESSRPSSGCTQPHHSGSIDIRSLKFKMKESLKRHSSSSENIQWFECDHCPLKLKHQRGLRKHMQYYHSDVKDIEKSLALCRPKPVTMRYRCDRCPAEFRHIRHMRRHLGFCHRKPENVQWIRCDQCPSKFQQEVSLVTHKSVCHPRPEDVCWFKCDQCTCKFKQSYYLKNHKKFCHPDP